MNIGRLAEDNIKRFNEYELVNFEGQWHTNVQINQNANRLGNALKSLGVKKGDRVGVQLLNCPQLMVAFFAVFKIGAILVPVNPSLRVHDLTYLYQDAGMTVLISSLDYLDNIKEARSGGQRASAGHPDRRDGSPGCPFLQYLNPKPADRAGHRRNGQRRYGGHDLYRRDNGKSERGDAHPL